MLDRNIIISEAVDRCLTEMYKKAQPSANWQDYVDMAKRGEIDKDELIFERHYLCESQFDYIANKYKEAFRCVNEWRNNCEFLLNCLKEGGFRRCFTTIGNDNHVKSAEPTPTLNELLDKDNAEKVYKLIKDLMEFYRFDDDEEKFNFNVYLGCSPTSNAQTVKDYWKSKGKDIEIDETELTEEQYWELDEFGHLLEEEE